MTFANGLPLKAGQQTYWGLFFIALSTLIFEILLTRIFSATMWYHFAFMALSLAMFGMTLGAIAVFQFPNQFSTQLTPRKLAIFALCFAVSITVSLFFYVLMMPSVVVMMNSKMDLGLLALLYIDFAIPFICSGVCTCLALTKFKEQTGKLYAADLLGAALACLLILVLLFNIDAPSIVFLTSALSCVAALFFSRAANARRLASTSAALLSIFVVATVGSAYWFNQNCRLQVGNIIFQKWSPMSFVTVRKVENAPWGWGIDPELTKGMTSEHHVVVMDCHAGTHLYKFDGDFSKLAYLKFDISNIVHTLKPDGDVFVIGIGGGKDILGALLCGHKTVVGAEFNNVIVDIVKKYFADYSGHIDKLPGVELVNDEARSYLARSGRKFSIIQATLIDTFAATANGGLALTENSLYTTDAWKLFLSHLTDNGVLSFTYAYSTADPSLAYRLCGMAGEALHSLGIENEREHIAIVGTEKPFSNQTYERSVATVLVSKQAFSDEQLKVLDEAAHKIHFKTLLSKDVCSDSGFIKILDNNQKKAFIDSYPRDIGPPTDDRPFFLCASKLSDYQRPQKWQEMCTSLDWLLDPFNPLTVMFALLFIIGLLTVTCIFLPLTMKLSPASRKDWLPLLTYFSSIGFGFMMIEIAQMERLSIYLGHPVFGLSVVLFTLLLTSGMGSLLVSSEKFKSKGTACLSLLLVVLLLAGLATPTAIKTAEEAPMLLRIALAFVLLGVPGLFMGMAMPLGMARANQTSSEQAPWLWGMNGAASVLGSVVATLISIGAGINATFWTGFFCYALCAFSYTCLSRSKQN